MDEPLCENASLCARAGEHPLSDHMPDHDEVQAQPQPARDRDRWRRRWWVADRWLRRLFQIGVTAGVWLAVAILWHEHVRIH